MHPPSALFLLNRWARCSAELRCEMPRCAIATKKGAKGLFRAEIHSSAWNVRPSHVLCNREDYGWRVRIKRMLEKGMSLEEIAENLNHKAIRRPHGSATWSATNVRKAFVS